MNVHKSKSFTAVEFAGIQCQIHYGDFQEEKHKPGLIENLSEYLPEQYSSSWGIEKKILREFRKHQGLGQLEAKFLYTKTARDLPTYGVTFFLVKEKQKGKKKLVPRLLGINAESILRLDEVSKEILQVWPLTQVKTYHAGMSETFTLNFGDYSDKEYSVKTNDAHRIRDILQGYIDIIRKRMEANYNLNSSEHYAIMEDNVQSNRGYIIERVEHKPSKIFEESFVGPSQIFTYEPGKSFAEGTQIVTVQQLVINAKGGSQQTVVTGEMAKRSLRLGSKDLIRKLNRLNSTSVKIVTLLSEPNQAKLSDAIIFVDSMESDMPSLIEALKKQAEMEPDEETRKKALDELQELSDCMKALSDNVANGKAEEAQEAAKRIADLSIQLCCAFDPGMIKRGEFCRRSRKSFIIDEKLNATLRRASCLAAAQTAAGTLNAVRLDLDKEYAGPPLDAAEVEELEKSAADKMAKLNAAVALNLTAYTDPRNIDYAAAVTSMNTINELLPELAKDAKALSSVKDGKNREDLLNAVRELCDAVAAVCAATDPDDHTKMEDAAKNYAQKAGKLLFTFRRGGRTNADKEKEILGASQDVVARTKSLVDRSKQLGDLAHLTTADAAALEEACDQCSTAADDVLICAQLTSSSIHEPHCRSAIKAASEALSSSAQHLAVTCKPMLQNSDSSDEGKDLKQKFLDLAAALDCLKESFAGFEEESPEEVKASRKLKFITTVGDAKKKMIEAENELNKSHTEPSKETAQELQKRLAQRIAQLNAALAALVAATSDRDKPDYETAELAVGTIAELMPSIVKDGKHLSSQLDPATRDLMLEDLRALCEVTKDICHNTDSGNLDDINNQASKLAKSSGKLIFRFKPHGKQNYKTQIEDISSTANEKAAQLIAGVQELCQQVGPGTELETANRRLADAVSALETATQLTAPCIEDPRCQESLISAANAVSSADQHLASVLAPLLKDPQHKAMGDKLAAQLKMLEEELDRLRKACKDTGAGGVPIDGQKRKEAIRLQFMRGGERIAGAQKLLDKPTVPLKSKVAVEDLRRKLADDVNKLNAAVAALVAATADRENPDSEATEEAINTINQLLPQVITDTKTLGSVEDEATREAMLADLRALCDATADIFNSTEQPNQDLNRAAVKFGAVSGRLVYVFDPRADQDREHVVLDLSSSACEKASALLSGVYQLANEVGGEEGTQLDNAGSKVADGANILLTTAQLTSPCIQDPSCRSKLLSSADVLEAASNNLASIWKPMVKNPNHSALGDTLNDYQRQLEEELEKLRKACQITDGGLQTKSSNKPVNEKQRLQFVSSTSAADNALKHLEKELDEPLSPSRAPVPASLQNKLAQSLAQLNAAIAALLAATSDRDNPDYGKAEQAIQEINQIMPLVVSDMRVVAASKDPQTRDLMLSDLRSACSAVRALCADTDSQGRNEQAAILADKCNKLYYVVSPRVDQVKEHEIIDLTTEACQKAAVLLSGVNQLASSVQGVAGSGLDAAGARTADATDALLATAQLTSASIHDPTSRAALLSSTDGVTSTLTALSSTWEPVVKDPVHSAKGVELVGRKKELEDALERLRKAIVEDRGGLQTKSSNKPVNEKQRLQFVSTTSAADITLKHLEKELDEPLSPSRAPVPASLQNKLAQSLAQLNAAIAALLAATSDRDNPDYGKAEQAIQEINQIMPLVVSDMRVVAASKDPQTRDLMLSDLRSACSAVRALCADTDSQGRNEQAAMLADKCNKLYYVVSPRVDQVKEHEIIDLTTEACQKAAVLLSGVNQLASSVQGVAGSGLDAAGARTADATDALLATAQLTSASIHDPTSRAALLSSTDGVTSTLTALSSTWEPVVKDPVHSAKGVELVGRKKELEDALERLRKAIVEDRGGLQTKSSNKPVNEKQRLQFVSTTSAADNTLKHLEKELDEPLSPSRAPVPASLQNKLAQSLAQLNAAIAALLAATSDNPDYGKAEQAIQEINQIMPLVVSDMRVVAASKDPQTRDLMLSDLRSACSAVRALCADTDSQGRNEQAAILADKCNKLYYVVSPRVDQVKEHEIIDLTTEACQKAAVLLSGVNQLASSVQGVAGSDLDAAGARTADATDALLATAQLTSASIHDPTSRAALLSSTDGVTSTLTALSSTWEPVVKDPVHSAKGVELVGRKKELEDALERLRKAIVEDRGAIKSPMKKAPPPPPRRVPSQSPPSAADVTQHFLDALRDDAARDAAAAAEKKKLDEEKAQQQKLRIAVDAAVHRVQKSGEELVQIYSSNAGITLSVEQTALMQKQMEHKLAAANAAAAKLVAAQHLNELDYTAASECTAPLAHTIEHIVQDAKCLRGALDEEERKAFLEDVLSMFDAAKVLLGAAKNDPRNINESAVVFGNKTAKLLYVVSTDIDPSQEKEVFVQARAIGDSASRLAVLAAEGGGARGDHTFMELCARGGACADAAGTMLYTAKLVAPCIQDPECQQTLTKSSDELSQLVGQYSTAWEAIQTDPVTKQELQKETEKLSQMLEAFKEDIQSGKLVRRRQVERIAVHDTPLRRLACAILEDAERRASQSSLPQDQRSAYARYGEQLNRAIRQVDRAYHHSAKAPHDLDKRLQLENAVQELQVAALMQRPTTQRASSNIVDLTDYVRAVSEDAEKLHSGCNDQPELQMVKEHCERIKDYAAQIMNPELYEETPGDGDRRDVAQFAEDCDKRVKALNSIIQSLQDGKVQIDLRDKAAQLSESTNLLNFATKCDLATTQSVSLDATLEELTDLEKKIDEMLLAGEKKQQVPYKLSSWPQSGRGRLVTAASRAGTGVTSSLTPAYAAYVDDVRVGGDLADDEYKQRSKDHLMRVLKLLKTLTMTNSRHVATWQPPNQPEMAEITEQIIKELENNDVSAVDEGQKSVLGEVDVSKLLLPTDAKIQVDPKQLPEKLNQAASKLSCAVGTLTQSANKPTSLARTVPSVYESAMALAAIVRSAPVKDIAHSKKIDEDSKEMSIQTYNVLKTAESVSHDPNNYAARRKFLDACNRLNDAISILVRSATPSDKLHKECAVSMYKLQQQGAAPAWGCSLGYPQILPALHSQRDVIEKLNDESPQSREEFSRSVAHVSSAVGSSANYAAHAAYLLSIADQHSALATEGFIDVGRIHSLSEALQESCYRVMMTEDEQAKEEAPIIIKQVQDFKEAVTEAQDKIKEEKDKNEIVKANNELEEAVTELNAIVHERTLNRGRLSAVIVRILEITRLIIYVIERVSVVPEIKEVSAEAKAKSDDVLKNCRNLNTKMLSLIRAVKVSEDDDPMTWVTFGTRKAVLDMFEALVNCVQENGKRAGILEPTDLDEEQVKRSFVQVQLDLANKWLARPTVKPEIKTSGEQAARTIISLGEKISEDLKGQEKEEMMDLVTSSEELLADCLKKHDLEKAHLLMERLKSLRKAIERCVVARIVDDFLEGEEPLADLDILCDAETDEEKRKFILERKIAELLANLGRVTKTARVAARAGCGADTVNQQLLTSSDQTELLAPMLVQAAQKRVVSPDDQAAIEHYQKLLAQYAESLANLRGLCDQAVDPMDFVQTAGETMQRLREDTTNDNDPQKCAYASTAITKLANRVITVSMSSTDVRKDPELQKALKEAKERLKAVVPGPNARPSRIPDWKITTAEILRTTGEVESVLGGEMIFKKQQTTDEPIFAAAYDLHAAMRSWSAKDNEIVAVAKRMAVLMAKLSDYMHTERKRDVIVTAKAIVSESREVAELARKLANECSDIRIKTNLLQICERIPTISGQLKMLATVKGSLGHQGLKEDQEDMNMLVGNAQNLMLSVQEAVNAAASASVKIMSQRGGPRMRWVRKSYY